MSAYSIVDIPGWENLSLNSADRDAVEARLKVLAHETLPEDAPRDSATPFRMEVLRHLTRAVEDARAAGAGLIHLPTQRLGGVTMPASYTVSEWRDTEGEAAAPDLVLQALAGNATGLTRLVDLDGQPGLREEEVVTPSTAGDPVADRPARRVTYTVASPTDIRSWVVFTFATIGQADPAGPLADALVELFDAHLTTLRWSEV